MADNVKSINASKTATPGKLYYDVLGKEYKGLPNGRLEQTGNSKSFNSIINVETGDILNDLSLTELELNFGSTPVRGKKFTIEYFPITSASLIAVYPSGNTAFERVGDDWEWDSIVFSAKPNLGSVTITARASGLIRGRRKILLTWQ